MFAMQELSNMGILYKSVTIIPIEYFYLPAKKDLLPHIFHFCRLVGFNSVWQTALKIEG